VTGMARRWMEGGGMLDRHGEEERGERGSGLVGRLACWAGSGGGGQKATGPGKNKKLEFNFELIDGQLSRFLELKM
jgi:hypothetical protein